VLPAGPYTKVARGKTGPRREDNLASLQSRRPAIGVRHTEEDLMPSFDVVSELDAHELRNAVDQARRELTQRYDFRGTETRIEDAGEGFTIVSATEDRAKAALLVFQEKLARRSVSQKFFEFGDVESAGGMTSRLGIVRQEGIPRDEASKILKALKGSKLKVQGQIQGDGLRVTGKKRDDLQKAMAMMKALDDLKRPLSFKNFRD